MIRNRSLLRLALTMLAALFVLGTANAAIACAAPDVMAGMCGGQQSDCGTKPAPDCALVCAPMCAAVEPSVTTAVEPELIPATYFVPRAVGRAEDFAGPDPPPPRMA